MKVSKRSILKITLGLVITLFVSGVLIFLFSYGKGYGFILKEIKKGQQRQVRLLCDTDHQALLKACRELSRRASTGDLKTGHYRVRLNPHSEALHFPQPILDLEPSYVEIDSNGRVMVELYGAFDNFGVFAYPEDYRAPLSNFHYGDKKLIDGLWYYDSDYSEKNPKYQKKIDALIQKGK